MWAWRAEESRREYEQRIQLSVTVETSYSDCIRPGQTEHYMIIMTKLFFSFFFSRLIDTCTDSALFLAVCHKFHLERREEEKRRDRLPRGEVSWGKKKQACSFSCVGENNSSVFKINDFGFELHSDIKIFIIFHTWLIILIKTFQNIQLSLMLNRSQ